MELLTFITDVGFPIASACVSFYFVYLTMKFILDGVLLEVKQQIQIIQQLDTRISAMSKDILKIDVLASQALRFSNIQKTKEESAHRKD